MSETWNEHSLNGCIFETDPKPAPVLSVSKGQIPDRVDLRAHCSPVENQLKTNSCVANAVVGAMEFHQKKAGLPATDLSRLFVYYNARSLSETEMQDTGSYIHHGMAAVLAYGACEARMWPFQEAMVTSKPTQACFKNARRYDAVQYARAPRGMEALSVLAAGLPIVFGIYVPGDFYGIAAQTGAMPKPGEIVPTRPRSGHAMLIVGYDTSDRTYLVRNSWGAGWADGGYLRIPFETMDKYSSPEDFWSIGAMEKTVGLQLSGPSVSESLGAFSVVLPDTMIRTQPGKADGLGSLRSELRSSLSSELESAKKSFRDRLRGK